MDTLPIAKQQAGAAWSRFTMFIEHRLGRSNFKPRALGSRMGAIGHVIGYGAGAIDLVSIFGSALGDTQFKQLTLIAATFILFSSSVTCWAVTERVLISIRSDPQRREGNFKVVRQIWATILSLPPRIQAICWIVFWSWIGWFPFLFYSTTWVGETYFRYDAPEDAKDSGDALGDIGRIGSTSLVIYSCITFAGAFILPLLVKSPEDDGFTRRPPESIARFVEKFTAYKPSLLTVWLCGHIIFSCSMALAPFATSFRFATFLVAVCGM